VGAQADPLYFFRALVLDVGAQDFFREDVALQQKGVVALQRVQRARRLRLEPVLPVRRSPAPVGDGQYLDNGFFFPVDDCERKPPQNELPGIVFAAGPATGRLDDQVHGAVQLGDELNPCRFAPDIKTSTI